MTVTQQQQQQQNDKKSYVDNNQSFIDRILQKMMHILHPNILEHFSSDICRCVVLSSTSTSVHSSNQNSRWNENHDEVRVTPRNMTDVTLSSPLHRILCHVVALHLSRTKINRVNDNSNDDDDNDDDDDDDDNSDCSADLNHEIPMAAGLYERAAVGPNLEQSPLLLLYQNLCNVATVWSQMTFLFQTDVSLQQHVTGFLLSGLSILMEHQPKNHDKDESYVLYYTKLATRLLEGVTHRMSSNQTLIRHDGMYIGQQLALLFGQSNLYFDELGEQNNHTKMNDVADKTALLSHEEKGDINDEETKDDESDWDGESEISEPYDIDDDRQDLRVVQRPLYLSECIDYLHSAESADNEHYRHETVLQDLSRLVRTRPPDLNDYGPELARRLVRLEDKYHLDNFSKLVSESMCSLVVEDPIAVGVHLILELFEDGSLHERLTILHALDEASYELSGYKQLECKESGEHELTNLSRTAGKRKIVSLPTTSRGTIAQTTWNGKPEERTRRWGKGRHQVADPAMIDNRFVNVAPEWFYLLSGKFMSCRENTVLWGGETGATLLSNVLLALSRIVVCAGPYAPGVDVLARDLWELVWPLRMADVANVRSSVLYAVGVSLGYLSEQTFYTVLMDSSSESLAASIQYLCDNDNDSDCRALANQIRLHIETAVGTVNNSRLLK